MKTFLVALVAVFALATPGFARANVVTDWNRTMIDALETAKTPPPPSARIAAIVQTSVYDAVNGIERRFAPYHVDEDAPRGASQRAAAAAAAHEALVVLFPAQKAMLDSRLAASLAQIGGDPDIMTSRWYAASTGESMWQTRSSRGERPTASAPCCRRTLPAACPETGHRLRRPSVHRSSGSSRT